MRKTLSATGALFVGCGLAASGTSFAESVTYDFTGVVVGPDSTAAWVGDTVSGTFTINFAAATQSTGTIGSAGFDEQGPYVFSTSGQVTSGNTVLFSYSTQAPGSTTSTYYIQGSDFTTYQGLEGQEKPGAIWQSELLLEAPTNSGPPYVYGANGLPISPLPAGLADASGQIYYDNETADVVYSADFDITSLTPAVVPLPAAAWLLLSGLGALGMFARKRAT
jgi:hypothetical protein